MDFEFRPRVGVTIVAALIALVLLALAVWQMARFFEKSALEDEWNARASQPPGELRSLDDFDADALDYRQVIAHGTLDTERVAIYDHQRFRGEPGCLIASPLRLEGGGTILTVRGFVPHTRAHRCEDAALTAATPTRWRALVHTNRPNLADMPNRAIQKGDRLRWDTFDVEGTYPAFGITDGPTTPTVLVLHEEHVGAPFPLASYEHLAAPYLTAMRHLNYAGTWLMTLLIVLGIWGGMSVRRVDAA